MQMTSRAKKTRDEILLEKGITIGEKLDSGGFGTVYKARHKGQTVAVKVIKIDPKKPSLDEDLNRELAILLRVKHPNIVKCFEALKTKRKVYIFMEFASGGTVGKYVRKYGPVPEWGVKLWFAPTAEALHYMHNLAIAHRDLKLDNILLDENNNPKLTDFGLSRFCRFDKSLCTRELSDTFCGTESYMPPEILQKKMYDPMIADIWSLGVCLYVMLNEVYPFDRRDQVKMVDNQMNRRWSIAPFVRPFISSTCEDLIGKMLEPDIKKRIALSAVLMHPWMPRIKKIASKSSVETENPSGEVKKH